MCVSGGTTSENTAFPAAAPFPSWESRADSPYCTGKSGERGQMMRASWQPARAALKRKLKERARCGGSEKPSVKLMSRQSFHSGPPPRAAMILS